MQAVARDAIDQWLVWFMLQSLQMFKGVDQGVTDPQKSLTMHLVRVIPCLIQWFSLNPKMAFKSLKTSIKSGPVLLPPAVDQADGEHLKVVGLPTFFEILGRPKGQLCNPRF
jgi:hypothetical protein